MNPNHRLRELCCTLPLVVEVARILPRIEWARWTTGPGMVVTQLRNQESEIPVRDALTRRRLLRAIRWVDGCLSWKGNCYRKALLEMALDRSAVRSALMLGFSVRGGTMTGHAWLAAESTPKVEYDFVIQL